jgi:hypothetical protein
MRPAPARTTDERKRDTLAALERELDAWVPSADAGGRVYLVPFSFAWDGEVVILAMPAGSLTARNLGRAGRARLGIGSTRDVVVVEGAVDTVPAGVEPSLEEAYAAGADWDPRAVEGEYVYLRVRPQTILAWREENELRGRRIMERGVWLA